MNTDRVLRPSECRRILEGFYERYHKPEYIDPDPLVFPRRYTDPADIEVAALLAASFALGRVGCITGFLEKLFARLGSPRSGLLDRAERDIYNDFSDMRYRFYSGKDISDFLSGIRSVLLRFGSLENCFMSGVRQNVPDAADGMQALSDAVYYRGCSGRRVMAEPSAGSACKRTNLFLRWVVRHDSVDPGFWGFPRENLLIPLDTHVMKVSRFLGLTDRTAADMRAVREITDRLKEFDKGDPVRYDFSMSRIGIHPDLSYKELEQEISR